MAVIGHGTAGFKNQIAYVGGPGLWSTQANTSRDEGLRVQAVVGNPALNSECVRRTGVYKSAGASIEEDTSDIPVPSQNWRQTHLSIEDNIGGAIVWRLGRRMRRRIRGRGSPIFICAPFTISHSRSRTRGAGPDTHSLSGTLLEGGSGQAQRQTAELGGNLHEVKHLSRPMLLFIE